MSKLSPVYNLNNKARCYLKAIGKALKLRLRSLEFARARSRNLQSTSQTTRSALPTRQATTLNRQFCSCLRQISLKECPRVQKWLTTGSQGEISSKMRATVSWKKITIAQLTIAQLNHTLLHLRTTKVATQPNHTGKDQTSRDLMDQWRKIVQLIISFLKTTQAQSQLNSANKERYRAREESLQLFN